VTETNPNENKPPAAQLGEKARQETIDVLCESFARDEMDMEQFEQRVELVYRAESMEQLRPILADLPTANLPVTVAPRPTLLPESIPGHSVMGSIMGSGGRRDGAWVPARHNWAVGVMGECVLDFREAQLGHGVTEVHGFAIMGGVEVLVPLDVRVECSGIGIMGSFDHKGSVTSTKDPEAPVIRVNGVAIMGGVNVRVRYPGETARDARLRSKAERKALRQIAKRK